MNINDCELNVDELDCVSGGCIIGDAVKAILAAANKALENAAASNWQALENVAAEVAATPPNLPGL